MESGFTKANSANLPKIYAVMLGKFFASNTDFCSSKFHNVETSMKAQAAKILFAFAIFLSFPLQNFVAYNIIWRKLQKKIPEQRRCLPDYVLRVVLVVIPWCLAIAIPKLGGFIALFGALCLSLLAMVFPGIMDLCLYYSHPKGYGPLKYRLIRSALIIMIGTAVLISGVYASTLDLMQGGGGH